MDVTESLAVDHGPAAITVRALSESTGMSNGAIYHAFGSRSGLVGHVWVRAAHRFLQTQRAAVDAAFADAEGGSEGALGAIVAAADAPAQFLLDAPTSGRFLLSVRRADLLGAADIPAETAAALGDLDRVLVELFVRLARSLWDRADASAVDAVRDCVVELPAALLLRGRREPDAAVRARLAAAVRAVAVIEPPAPTVGAGSSQTQTKGRR